jgi:arabinan endo-1,5-alpha-L-arabinosidase
VTDGPWLHRLTDGELLILWSSLSEGVYSVGVARSKSGQLTGPWTLDARPFYSSDGGHCMTLRDFSGNLWLSLHQPDKTPLKRPIFLPLADEQLKLVRF